jgi:hypothetical protein
MTMKRGAGSQQQDNTTCSKKRRTIAVDDDILAPLASDETPHDSQQKPDTHPHSYCAQLLFHKFREGAPRYVDENPQTGVASEFINMDKAWADVHMQNGRHMKVCFDSDGVELVDMPTKVTDFYDDKQVTSTYYSELDKLLRKVTGCSGTRVFDTIRRTTSQSMLDGRPLRSPADFVHGDMTPEAVSDKIRLKVPDEADCLMQKRRYSTVTVWRSMVGTIKQKPMAFMLQSKEARLAGLLRSVERTNPVEHRTTFVEFGVYSDHSSNCSWVTFPNMTMSEAAIFKISDSADPLSAIAHSSFKDPFSKPDDPPRQSIEARVLCYWD